MLFNFKFVKFILDKFYKILSPPYCAYCYIFLKDYYIFCDDCFKKITPVVSCTLEVTPKYKMSVYAASEYKYPLKKLILAKIFSDRLASKQLAQIIWQKTDISNLDFDFIIPVPLHWTRLSRRGFNQAEIMAREISKFSGKPVIDVVRRNKKTLFQRALLSHQRQSNLKNAFELKKYSYLNNLINIFFIKFKSKIKHPLVPSVLRSLGEVECIEGGAFENKKILIVDDLMTTGSTLVNLAKEIKKLKPSSIIAVVGCRTI